MTNETATYEAEFLCGHQRTYPLPDGLDPDFLAGIAAMRVCPDCALNAHLRTRSTDVTGTTPIGAEEAAS